MAYHLFVIVCILEWVDLSVAALQNGSSPIQFSTSPKHYGPYGPWQAIAVWLESESIQIDPYPGSIYSSIVL